MPIPDGETPIDPNDRDEPRRSLDDAPEARRNAKRRDMTLREALVRLGGHLGEGAVASVHLSAVALTKPAIADGISAGLPFRVDRRWAVLIKAPGRRHRHYKGKRLRRVVERAIRGFASQVGHGAQEGACAATPDKPPKLAAPATAGAHPDERLLPAPQAQDLVTNAMPLCDNDNKPIHPNTRAMHPDMTREEALIRLGEQLGDGAYATVHYTESSLTGPDVAAAIRAGEPAHVHRRWEVIISAPGYLNHLRRGDLLRPVVEAAISEWPAIRKAMDRARGRTAPAAVPSKPPKLAAPSTAEEKLRDQRKKDAG